MENLQGVNLEDEEDQYYLAKSVAHYLGLPAPKNPIFAGLYPSLEEEEVENIKIPYAMLKTFLKPNLK